jgi:hypothetical protein
LLRKIARDLQHLRRFHLTWLYFFTLKIKAERSSETSQNTYQKTDIFIAAVFVCSVVGPTVSSHFPIQVACLLHPFHFQLKTPWFKSPSELYRSSDLSLSAKLVPTLAD